MRDDETTRAERAEQIALFRYGLISDLLHAESGEQERPLYVRLRDKAAKSYCIPGSRRTRVATETLRDWLTAYKAGGFDALRPKPRADIGHARAIPQPLCDLLVMLKDDHRDWSVATVIATAQALDAHAAALALPVSTVHRLLSRAGVMGKRPEEPTSKDRRRFAYEHAGELWMSDVMHGPAVVVGSRRKQKTYLIGLLDDATRVVPYAAFALSENTTSLLPVLKQAVMRRGIPLRLYVDNGSAFRSHHLSLVCARLGITLIHARPYTPQGKGKQERFFRTVRMQLLPTLGETDLGSLDALNRRLWAWVEGEYHQAPHKGLEGQTPLDAWAMRSGQVRGVGPELDLREMFLLEASRRVRADRTVSLDGVVYEVDASLVGDKVVLRFDPAKRGAPVDVWHGGKKIEQARVVDLRANCLVKRHNDAPEGVRMRDLGDGNDDSGPEVA
jgi:putative transposase